MYQRNLRAIVMLNKQYKVISQSLFQTQELETGER